MKSDKNKLILYVDDDAEDREFLFDALSKANPDVHVELVPDGLAAMKYLQQRTPADLPCLIVLDLNMPFINGKELCDRIREDENLRGIQIIIFSSSEKPADKIEFNQMGIEFFSKPLMVDRLREIAEHMVVVCCGD